MNLDKTMKTYENWTKPVRDELKEKDLESADIDADIPTEQVKQELKQKRTFIIGATSEEKKRYVAKKHLIEEHGLDDEVAENAEGDVVTDLVIELEAEGIMENYRPLLDGETKDEMWENYQEPMGFNVAEESGPEPPGEEWTCACGTFNEGNRSVCRNLSCTRSYEDVNSD